MEIIGKIMNIRIGITNGHSQSPLLPIHDKLEVVEHTEMSFVSSDKY